MKNAPKNQARLSHLEDEFPWNPAENIVPKRPKSPGKYRRPIPARRSFHIR